MRKFLFEADDDNTAQNANDQTTNDTAADDGNANSEDNQDNNTEDNSGEDQNQEDTENQDDNQDSNEEDNYDIKDEDNGGDEEENNDEDQNQEDTENQDGNQDSNEEDNSSEDNNQESLKKKDRELFDSLSIPEQQIKIKELKNQFASLYNNCSSIIERLNDLAIELIDEYPQLKKVNKVLYELKNMISFYILNIYDTKSFFENDIIFNRYLAILNSVKAVLTTIKNDKNDDK